MLKTIVFYTVFCFSLFPVILRYMALLEPCWGPLRHHFLAKTDSMGVSKIARAEFQILFGPSQLSCLRPRRPSRGPQEPVIAPRDCS